MIYFFLCLATIYAFNTNINQTIAVEASRKQIPIRTFNVIYHMLNDIKDELTKRIPSTEEDVQTGSADVLQTFEITVRNKKIQVAGCRITDGSFEKKQLFKLIRNGQVIHRGKFKFILFFVIKVYFFLFCLKRYIIIFKTST